jgi:hypothetical protein
MASGVGMSLSPEPVDPSDALFDDINFDQIDEDLAAFQEDDMVQQALSRGVDLQKYGRDLEKELKIAETESVAQYVDNNTEVLGLHKQMQDCDSVLARMQVLLLGFQDDLGGISEEIKHLQDESLSMSIKLKNRRAAEEKLHAFIDKCVLSPDYCEKIVSNEVSDGFLQAVVSLSEKLKYLTKPHTNADTIAPAETYTGRTLLPDLEKLKLRSISKIKDYFSNQFQALRKPKTNVQFIQQSALVKYAPLLKFLQTEAPTIAEDLRTLYIESMGRTLLNLFKSYCTQLLKLDIVIATKNDLIGVEEVMLKSVFSQKVNLSKRTDTFSLGERDKILDQVQSETYFRLF